MNYRFNNIDGFKSIALLTNIEGTNKNLVNSFVGADKMDLSSYRDIKITCEHCNTKHERKYSVLLQDVNTGTIKQVGKSCLQKYTNTDKINRMLSFYEMMEETELENNFVPT